MGLPKYFEHFLGIFGKFLFLLLNHIQVLTVLLHMEKCHDLHTRGLPNFQK